jgi:hypothetical protein
LLYEPDWTEADTIYAGKPSVSRELWLADHGSTDAAKTDHSSLFWFLRTIYGPIDRAETALRRRRGSCTRTCCTRRNRTIVIWVYGAGFTVLHAVYEPTLL